MNNISQRCVWVCECECVWVCVWVCVCILVLLLCSPCSFLLPPPTPLPHLCPPPSLPSPLSPLPPTQPQWIGSTRRYTPSKHPPFPPLGGESRIPLPRSTIPASHLPSISNKPRVTRSPGMSRLVRSVVGEREGCGRRVRCVGGEGEREGSVDCGEGR